MIILDERSEDLGERFRRAVAGVTPVMATSVMTDAMRAVRQKQ
jgi:hypothetical protein